jgi:alpha-galactosidase
MRFGVYTDRGTLTCGGRAGALGYETADAKFYARNGIDYVKEDSCNADADHQTAFHQYAKMRDALNATGRPIFFSLCGWSDWYAPVCHTLGNSCRIAQDDTNWAGVLVNIDVMASVHSYAGPGGFNDPCLLLGRDVSGNEDVTDLQGRFQFSMWAIMAAPMLMSSNVRNLTAFQRETYLNLEVIAVNQDVLGRAGQRLVGGSLSSPAKGSAATNVWGRPLSDGSWAFAFVNTDPSPTADLVCDAACLSLTGWEATQSLAVRDLWAHKMLPNTTASAGLSVTNLEGNGGARLLKVWPIW